MHEIYSLFVEYFDNIKLTKMNDDGDYSIYMALKQTMLQNQYDYIIVMVDKDLFFPGHVIELNNLKWKEFHTQRYSQKLKHCIVQSYRPKHTPFYGITKISKNGQISLYKVDKLPLQIVLEDDANNMYDYPDKSGIVNALETFHARVYNL